MAQIPKHLQGILWSADIEKLDLIRDKQYIIHQILCYGRWEHLRWLFSIYPKSEIVSVFLDNPYKDYSFPRLNFVKNHLLNLKDHHVNEYHYVKNIPRDLR